MGNTILIILLIVFITLVSSKKKKPTQGQKAAPQTPAARQAKDLPVNPHEAKAVVSAETPGESPSFEGAFETQGIEGETEAEHAGHIQKMHQVEAAMMHEMQAQRKSMETNRNALRTAVILREVLDRPVSLRDE